MLLVSELVVLKNVLKAMKLTTKTETPIIIKNLTSGVSQLRKIEAGVKVKNLVKERVRRNEII